MIQKANDGMDAYNKKQTEDMTDVLLGQYGLYNKMSKLAFFSPAMKEAFENMHGDYLYERDKKTFDIINGVKEFLMQNPDGEDVTN
jgi:hypothetical protein